jgi:hypothetical protein
MRGDCGIDASVLAVTATSHSIGDVELREHTLVEDPNGVIVQLVRWVAAPPEAVTA